MHEQKLNSLDEARELIEASGLYVTEKPDYTMGIFEGKKLLATGSLKNDLILLTAVSSEYQGEDLLAKVVTHLVQVASEHGIFGLHLYTKPENIHFFTPLGFSVVAVAKPYAALLEYGNKSIDDFCQKLKNEAIQKNGRLAAIVMNCNPFTLGHLHLVTRAADESDAVYILVVEEELSEFSFDLRFKLVNEGVSHLKNVFVLRGGSYTVSALTFPAYFTGDSLHAAAQCALDIEIFAQHIAPALGASVRYVGTEPLSKTTGIYNQTMKKRLPLSGIEVVEIPRFEIGGEAVSASRVRALLKNRDYEALTALLPASTYDYLVKNKIFPASHLS